MKPVVTVDEMRAVDAEAQRTVPVAVLVQRAGTALARVALQMLGGAYGRRVVVLAGSGNNGADGRVAGALLARRGAVVTVADARGSPGQVGAGADLVIDAAVGTGFHGRYDAPAVPPGVAVLACDIPSGVHGDTGVAAGRPLAAVRTVTFAAWKPGLLQGDGPALAGHVTVADIGLDCSRARVSLVEDADVDGLPARPPDAHKWQTAVAVVAGSPGMTGAAALCARAAGRAGAGMVRLGVPGADPGDLPAGEAVGIALPAAGWADEVVALSRRCAAVVVGPGLGRGEAVAAEVRRLVARCPVPVVVDADGLHALGDPAALAAVVSARGRGDVVLTPHDGELARLAGSAPGPDRLAAARGLAAASGAVVLSKGPTTVVARPDGRAHVVRAGSPRLATAGTGDVLAGMIGAFVARGVAPPEAAALAAHVHGRAAGLGRAEGLLAGDLPELVADWLSARAAGAARSAGAGTETGAARSAGAATEAGRGDGAPA